MRSGLSSFGPGFLARHPVAGFLAFSHGWTWGFWAVAALLASGGGSVWSGLALSAFLVGGAGIVLGAVVMAGATQGRAGLVRLGRSNIDPRPLGLWHWAVALGLYPGLTLLAGAILLATGQGSGLAGGIGAPGWGALLVTALFLLLIGPLPEEIGWRGYLLDRLLPRLGVVVASLTLALIWWSWHIPLHLLPGYFDAFEGGGPHLLYQLAGLIPASILLGWIYVSAGRSIFAAIVLHWSGNMTGQLLQPDDSLRLIRLGLELAAAGAVLLLWWRTPPGARAKSTLDRAPLP